MTECAATAASAGWKWHQQFPEVRLIQQKFHRIEPKNLSELLSPAEPDGKPIEMETDSESGSGPSPCTITKPTLEILETYSTSRLELYPSAALESTSMTEGRQTIAGHSNADNSEDAASQGPLRRPSCPSPRSQEATHANILHLRERLRGWGLYFLKDPCGPDAMIQAVSINPKTPVLSPKEQSPFIKLEPVSTNEERMASETTLKENKTQKSPDMLEMKAIVWPRDGRRKRFLIQRKFNVTELRASIPEPTTKPDRRFSMLVTTRLITRKSATRGKKILASPVGGPFSPLSRSSPTSVASAAPALCSMQQRRALIEGGPSRNHPFLNNAQPIHLPYARAYLPVLAALLLSGYIRKGDVIELPLPRPEAWKETVEFVYGVKNNLPEAVKENILHLGGKV